ncbi:MAG: hypothetical protein IV104_14510 [Acidovorax sp.]|nr:hypothetical protein [Acidovorax sp.]
MKYIQQFPGGEWDLTAYFVYLNANQGKFPLEAINFALDQRNYDLTSHQSLHDAWLEWFLVSEPATGARSETRGIQIECRLLGPFHDCYIELKYIDVQEYKITAGRVTKNPLVGHGDLLMHEMRIERSYLIHEMVFSGGSIVEITSGRFSHQLINR